MPLLLSQKVAFIHIPKTGGTTIEQILLDAFPNDVCCLDNHGFGPLRYDNESEAMREMRYRAAVAGYTTAPSMQHWTYADLKCLVPDLDKWWSFAIVRSPWSRLYSEYRYLTHFLKRCSQPFDEWVPKVLLEAAENPSIYDNHLRVQGDFLGEKTAVFRFEQLSSSIVEIAKRLGIRDYRLPHHYRSGEQDEYRSAYTKELVDLVGNHYQQDIERFGYSFE